MNHNDIIQFYKALVSLYYGNHEKYLIALKKVIIEKLGDEL